MKPSSRLLRLPDDMLSTYRLTAPVHRILSLQTAFVAAHRRRAPRATAARRVGARRRVQSSAGLALNDFTKFQFRDRLRAVCSASDSACRCWASKVVEPLAVLRSVE